jgi:uracil-DNA glycosylase
MMTTSADFQRRLRADYLTSIEVPEPFFFTGGEQVRAIPPIDVASGTVMILGAYPSAIFETHQGRKTPVKNIACPFDTATPSGRELEEHYLKPLGIVRSDCWITNLVKVFLFKSGHDPLKMTDIPMNLGRGQFETVAVMESNMNWLIEELQLADPKIVITLGSEVAGVLHATKRQKERNALLNGSLNSINLGGREYKALHLAHPGIIMRDRKDGLNPWPLLHRDEHIPNAKAVLHDLL